MKTTKILITICVVLFLTTIKMNAQVTIGTHNAPHAAAGLDIQMTTKGLKLPSVALNADLTQFVLDGSADKATAKGMLVYNTTDNMVYMWNGTRWNSTSLDASMPIITVQPKAFSFSQNTSPNGGSITALSVTAINATAYQWYQKSTNENSNEGTAINGATESTYAPPLIDLGLNAYYCVVSNANGSAISNVAEVAVGCGAKTIGGGWLKFQCYNLGVDVSSNPDPFTWSGSIPGSNPSTTDTQDGIKGALFQWGRWADGHQNRSSATVSGPYTGPFTNDEADNNVTDAGTIGPAYGQVPSSDDTGFYGSYITGTTESNFDWRSPAYDLLWRPYRWVNDPCRTNSDAGTTYSNGTESESDYQWRIPTQNEWSSIFSGTTGTMASNIASANTWTWTGNGYQIKPDGQTVTLFLPAAGSRGDSNGLFYNVGVTGIYWSSTPYSFVGQDLGFDSYTMYSGAIHYRAIGFSIRCVAQN